MNREKAERLVIAQHLSRKYLRKDFRDLPERVRILIAEASIAIREAKRFM